MTRDVALGIDVGTTAVKAGLLFLDDAAPMEVAARPHPTHRPATGRAEQDPADWMAGIAATWAELRARCGPVRLRAIGLCSQVNTHLIADAALRPIGPAITWQDLRAAPEAAEIDAAAAPRRTELWGGPFVADASFSLSRLLWIARHDPAAWAAARWVFSPKDWCVAALTGVAVTDAISPIGVVGPDGRYLDAVLALAGDAARVVPPILAFDAPAGTTLPGNAADLPAGVPVATGTMDAWGSIFGSGLVRPGQAMEVSGTSEIIAIRSDRTVPTPGVISFAPVRGAHLHAGPTQAGGDSLAWAARAFGIGIPELLALAAEGRRDPQPIVFLPHLAGERAPIWDPHARGTFLGITTATELRHLALAVLEGVAFSARHLLGACVAAAGRPADELRLSGGGARSPLWNVVKASVHGRPLLALATRDSGVLGSALLGLVAAGIEPDMDAAGARRVHVAATVDPEPGHVGRLEDLYGVYRAAQDALLPLFPRLGSARTVEGTEAESGAG